MAVDGDGADQPALAGLSAEEARFVVGARRARRVRRADRGLGHAARERAPLPAARELAHQVGTGRSSLMSAIVPLIFLAFLLPSLAYGVAAKSITSHRGVVVGMTKAMGTMAYYLVMVFFAAIFIDAFNRSNLGALIALKGRVPARHRRGASGDGARRHLHHCPHRSPGRLGFGRSAALLSPILVPMLMTLGISPELTRGRVPNRGFLREHRYADDAVPSSSWSSPSAT